MLTTAEMELEEILDKAGPEMRDIARAIYDVGVDRLLRLAEEIADEQDSANITAGNALREFARRVREEK